MTTLVTFAPTQSSSFQFQAVFDDTAYTVVVTWNLFGQRYYVNVYTVTGTLIYSLPLIGSPQNYDISMNAGYFATTFIYRTQNQQFEIGN